MAIKWEEIAGSERFKGASLTQKRELRDKYFQDFVARPAPFDNDLLYKRFLDRAPLPLQEDVKPPTLGDYFLGAAKRVPQGIADIGAMVMDIPGRVSAALGADVEPGYFARQVEESPVYGMSERERELSEQYPTFEKYQGAYREIGAELPFVAAAPLLAPKLGAAKTGRAGVGATIGEEFSRTPGTYVAKEFGGATGAGAAMPGADDTTEALWRGLLGATVGSTAPGAVKGTATRVARRTPYVRGMMPKQMTTAERMASELLAEKSTKTGIMETGQRRARGVLEGKPIEGVGERYTALGSEEVYRRAEILDRLGVPEEYLTPAALTGDEGLAGAVRAAMAGDGEFRAKIEHMERKAIEVARLKIDADASPDEFNRLVSETAEDISTTYANARTEFTTKLGALGVGVEPDVAAVELRGILDATSEQAKTRTRNLYDSMGLTAETITFTEFKDTIDTLRKKFGPTKYAELEPSTLGVVRGKAIKETVSPPPALVLDASGNPITRTESMAKEAAGELRLDELEEYRQMLNMAQRQLQRAGTEEAPSQLLMVNAAIKSLNNIEKRAIAGEVFDAEMTGILGEARAASKHWSQTLGFAQPDNIASAATDRIGVLPKIKDEKLTAKIVAPGQEGQLRVRQYFNAIKDAPEDITKATETMRQYLIKQLHSNVPDGEELTMKHINAFRKKYGPVLAEPQFRDFNVQITGVERARKMVDQYGFNAPDDLHLRRRDAIQERAIKGITGQSPDVLLDNIWNSGNPALELDVLLKELGGETVAKQGIKDAFLHKLFRAEGGKMVTSVFNDGVPEFSQRTIREVLADPKRRPMLEKLFTKQELNNWALAGELQEIMMRGVKPVSLKGSDTAMNLMQNSGIGRVIYWTSARSAPMAMAGQAFVTGVDRILSRLRSDEAQKIFITALADQKTYRTLATEWRNMGPKQQTRALHLHLMNTLGKDRADELMQGEE